MSIKSIFLDRDGVINKELNYVYKIEDFEFIEGIFSACQFLQKLDYKIIIITNQSGIDRNYTLIMSFTNYPSGWLLNLKKTI